MGSFWFYGFMWCLWLVPWSWVTELSQWPFSLVFWGGRRRGRCPVLVCLGWLVVCWSFGFLCAWLLFVGWCGGFCGLFWALGAPRFGPPLVMALLSDLGKSLPWLGAGVVSRRGVGSGVWGSYLRPPVVACPAVLIGSSGWAGHGVPSPASAPWSGVLLCASPACPVPVAASAAASRCLEVRSRSLGCLPWCGAHRPLGAA